MRIVLNTWYAILIRHLNTRPDRNASNAKSSGGHAHFAFAIHQINSPLDLDVGWLLDGIS